MCVETLSEGLGTKQERAGKAAARKHSVNILVAREVTKERPCLLGRKTRKLTDVAKEVVSIIFSLLSRISCEQTSTGAKMQNKPSIHPWRLKLGVLS